VRRDLFSTSFIAPPKQCLVGASHVVASARHADYSPQLAYGLCRIVHAHIEDRIV